MKIERSVYVISDLHVGGNYADDRAQHADRKRGFRMMTRVKELSAFVRKIAKLPNAPSVELVVNGDFIDFLAEEEGAGGKLDLSEPPTWTPFRARRGEALQAFKLVVSRDGELFQALNELLKSGKTLTILLGNHDIELCLPDVRAALEAELGPGTLRFLDDGQALDLGDVLIDHGNLFDPANVVDHDRLRLVRAAYSRGWFEDLGAVFTAPAGSKLVATVMNPIKVKYGFIDLLKPESEPLFALLLALEPGYRGQIGEATRALAHAIKTLVPKQGVPYRLRNVGDDNSGTTAQLRDVAGHSSDGEMAALDGLIATVLANDPAAAKALKALGSEEARAVNVAGGWRPKWSLLGLLLGEETGDLDARLPAVQGTLRALDGDRAFRRDQEEARYLDAAKWLATQGPDQKGYKAVVFGHTHHAKQLPIAGTNATYFNTGTWANLMRFPAELTREGATADQVKQELLAFATKVSKNDLDSLVVFAPTYVRLDLDGKGKLIKGELRDYDWKMDTL
jgi:UDP-2,3-diacylglucosamine pyrophosphatase LpxH